MRKGVVGKGVARLAGLLRASVAAKLVSPTELVSSCCGCSSIVQRFPPMRNKAYFKGFQLH